MRRAVLLLVGVLLSTVALGSDSPKEYDDGVKMDDLEGTWRLTESEYKGRKDKYRGQSSLTFRGDIFTLNHDTRGSYRIDPTRKPAHLDYSRLEGSSSGKTLKWIYQIHGDTLRIGNFLYDHNGLRPQGFNDEGVLIRIYKRVK